MHTFVVFVVAVVACGCEGILEEFEYFCPVVAQAMSIGCETINSGDPWCVYYLNDPHPVFEKHIEKICSKKESLDSDSLKLCMSCQHNRRVLYPYLIGSTCLSELCYYYVNGSNGYCHTWGRKEVMELELSSIEGSGRILEDSYILKNACQNKKNENLSFSFSLCEQPTDFLFQMHLFEPTLRIVPEPPKRDYYSYLDPELSFLTFDVNNRSRKSISEKSMCGYNVSTLNTRQCYFDSQDSYLLDVEKVCLTNKKATGLNASILAISVMVVITIAVVMLFVMVKIVSHVVRNSRGRRVRFQAGSNTFTPSVSNPPPPHTQNPAITVSEIVVSEVRSPGISFFIGSHPHAK